MTFWGTFGHSMTIYMRIFYGHYATYGLDDYEIANIRPKNKNYTIKIMQGIKHEVQCYCD